MGKRDNIKKDTPISLATKEQNIEQKPNNKDIPELSENINKLEKAYEVLENFDHKNFKTINFWFDHCTVLPMILECNLCATGSLIRRQPALIAH